MNSPPGRAWTVTMAMMLASLPLLPASTADTDVDVGKIVDFVKWAVDETVPFVQNYVPQCTDLPVLDDQDPDWDVVCHDDQDTWVKCRFLQDRLIFCRIIIGGSDPIDVSEAFLDPLLDAALDTLLGLPQHVTNSVQKIADAGTNVARVVQEEAQDLVDWILYDQVSDTYWPIVYEIVQEEAQQAEETAHDLLGFALRSVDGARKIAFGILHEACEAVNDCHGIVPITLCTSFDAALLNYEFCTVNRNGDDPCHEGMNPQAWGEDNCGLFDLLYVYFKFRLGCNAYTAILWGQSCGGYQTDNWKWSYKYSLSPVPVALPDPLDKAHLKFESPDRFVVHDYVGGLECWRNPAGGWLGQYYYDDFFFQFWVFDDLMGLINGVEYFYQYLPFLPVAPEPGTCTLNAASSNCYRVSFDSNNEGNVYRMEGTFVRIGESDDLVNSEQSFSYDEDGLHYDQLTDGTVHPPGLPQPLPPCV